MPLTAPSPVARNRLLPGALLAALVGAVGWVIALVLNPAQALYSYLAAWVFAWSIAASAVILLMILHAAHAGWPVAIRRLVEGISGTLPLLVVGFIPIAIGMRNIYPWIPKPVPHLSAYLNEPFFLVRAVIENLGILVVGEFLRRWSIAQDANGSPELTLRARLLSAGALPPFGILFTFASFDWLMSLTPTWRSSVYGLYVFAGGFLGALSVLLIAMASLRGDPRLAGAPRGGHFLSVGKLMLAFVIVWAYLFYSQFFIQWIANLPSEVSWWIPRMTGWGAASTGLVVVNFVVPFALLLSRALKRRPRVMAMLSCWIVVAHFFDMYWLVLPTLHPGAPRPHVADLAAFLLVTGATVAFGLWRARGVDLLARRDPLLSDSLRYEGT